VLAVLHPGAMGAAVAACLVGRGHEVGWLCTGRSEASLHRAEQAGLTTFDDLAELLGRADIVFSICPPHAALEVARRLAVSRGSLWTPTLLAPRRRSLSVAP
jgi:3-hydroxyisobutyrate dehydrogenase-like beta-hydroxyacid dehydrogenase